MFKINLICRRRAVGYQLVMPSVGSRRLPTVAHWRSRRWASGSVLSGGTSFLPANDEVSVMTPPEWVNPEGHQFRDHTHTQYRNLNDHYCNSTHPMWSKVFQYTYLAYFTLQDTLVMLNTLCKVEDHENHVRWIYFTTVLYMGESQKYARR